MSEIPETWLLEELCVHGDTTVERYLDQETGERYEVHYDLREG
jgi:hypothetical protein